MVIGLAYAGVGVSVNSTSHMLGISPNYPGEIIIALENHAHCWSSYENGIDSKINPSCTVWECFCLISHEKNINF